MKFVENKRSADSAGVYLSDWEIKGITNGDVTTLCRVLESFSAVCGEKTRKKMIAAINKRPLPKEAEGDEYRGAIDYSDTPLRGRHYIYLWFDSDGEIFYIGKGEGNRATNLSQRSNLFKEKAVGGKCIILAYNIDEIYALDLEKILILESVVCGKQIINVKSGSGVDAVQYCTKDRHALLWYWNHVGVVDRFSKLIGENILYDATNSELYETLDERHIWWEYHKEIRTNDKKKNV